MSSERDLINSGGKVSRWPKKPTERKEVLAYLASKFISDRPYDENEVNQILKQWHTYGDWASLRRELVGFGYAVRDKNGTEYWFSTARKKTVENIRDFNQDADTDQVLDLLKEFQNHLAQVDKENEIRSFSGDKDARLYLQKMIDDVAEMNGRFLVLDMSGELVGFIQGIIDPRNDQDNVMYQTTHNAQIEGWIGLVYVKENIRGGGYGRKLIEAMRQYFTENGCTTLRLIVAHDNVDTVNFYHKFGFIDRDIEMALPL